MERKGIRGLPGIATIGFGQSVSLVGSNMTNFGLMIWAWQVTGRATALALVGVFSFLPMILLSPIAGVYVDRWNRKRVMIWSDLAAGMVTIALFTLFRLDRLEVWHLFISAALYGCFNAFQQPAFGASISLMVSRQQYARANGLIAMSQNATGILAPILAGALLGFIGLGGIMIIDIVTFLFAVGSLLLVHVPQPVPTEASATTGETTLQRVAFGLRYILRTPSLRALTLVFFVAIVALNFSAVTLNPMILARTGNDEIALGTFNSIISIGAVLGGALLAAWGGPKRRTPVLLICVSLIGVGYATVAAGRGLIVWVIGGFITTLVVSMTVGINQSIWQAKVPADIQGRVLAARFALANWGRPLIMIAAGPVADYLCEPAMASDTLLARIFEPIVGLGPGTGMATMLFMSAILVAVVGLGGFAAKSLRRIESLLPDLDHETAD